LELACGKAEYTSLSLRVPGYLSSTLHNIFYELTNITRATEYGAALKTLDGGVSNVGFLRIQIEMLLDYFSAGEVDEIWITFPDPQPQISRGKKEVNLTPFPRNV